MATGDSTSCDLNHKLELVLEQLTHQREEINSLRDDVKGTSLTVNSEAKKFKEKEMAWKREGNKIQFTFNSDIADIVTQAIWAIENKKGDYALELLHDADGKLRKRNKLIRIADTSECGWETVRQYESNPVASDSDDENKITKAENRALRKRKRTHQKKSTTATSMKSMSNPMSTRNTPLTPWGDHRSQTTLYNQYGPSTSTFRPYKKQFGSCFACGEFTHLRRDCPYVQSNKQGQSTDSTPNRK